MRSIRIFCILLCLCLLFGCGSGETRPAAADRPPVHVTYTPDPTTAPELELELTETQRQAFDDLLLIGYLYEDFQQDKDRLPDPEGWESLCQTRILDALYYFHEDSLPPYLTGEGIYDDELHDTAIVSQTELDAFFQSVLGRPNLVLDRVHYDEDFWPDLQPGQVPLPPTDYSGWAETERAIEEPGGTLCLYGRAGWSESSYAVICRVRPTEGFLGYRIESAEICTIEPAAAPRHGSEVTALLYAGESMQLYHGYLQGRPGLFVVSRDWNRIYYRFQELPGTLEQKELTIVSVEVEPLEKPAEARVYIRYLDDDWKERILCADRSHENSTLLYPLSPEPGLELTEVQWQYYGDLMLMGYIRERVYRDYRLYEDDMEAWESSWQWCILDALFFNYGDELPPYLAGETVEVFDGEEQAALVSKAELERFFQSALGLPCMVQAGDTDRQVYPELKPDQIILYPSEYYFEPDIVQAVREPDGTICLYGRMSGFELLYCVVTCRIRLVDGYLGGQLVSAEMYPAIDVANDPALIFAP